MCIKRHREPRTQRLLADALDRSPRWMAYAEAGKTDVGWSEMVAIATILGPIKGRAFLDDATALLYQEAEVEGVMRDALATVQRRAFLSAVGTAGALGGGIDFERLERGLQGLLADSAMVKDMASLTQIYLTQSRVLGSGAVLPALQAHLRNYLNLATTAPPALSNKFKAGAAEAALLSGVLTYRSGATPEALQYYLLASGLASESGYSSVSAYVMAMRRTALFAPATLGGTGNGNFKECQSMLDQGLAMIGAKPKGIVAATLLSWRADDHATIGDAEAAERDLDAARQALSNVGNSEEDLIGLGTRTELELTVEHAICALGLRQPDKVIEGLETEEVMANTSSGWRAARLSELAGAYAQKGEIEHSVSLFSEAADLAITAREPWRIRWVDAIRQRWLPVNLGSEGLRDLDLKLASALAG
jgi:hypothetical protein